MMRKKRKGKGKFVKTHSKVEKKRYGTRSVAQKVLESALEPNATYIERIHPHLWSLTIMKPSLMMLLGLWKCEKKNLRRKD